MKKVLITWALAEESVSIESRNNAVHTIITGVGKARAAIATTRAICTWHPDLIINVGTAGTIHHTVGDVLVCNRFVDRDHAKAQLPGLTYEVDMQPALAAAGVGGAWPSMLGGVGSQERFVVNTGDNFVTQHEPTPGDVFDMEAFAQALAARQAGIPLLAVKYVTDVIGRNSVKHWQDKLHDARQTLEAYFDRWAQEL